MRPHSFFLIGNCASLGDGEAINEMVAKATRITRKTFLRWANPSQMREIERELGYGSDLPMARDWAVSYWKSTYLGVPAVYFDWSAYEYVFTPDGVCPRRSL